MIHSEVAHRVAERAARESYGKLLAYLTARCGDLVSAEDALADAFAGALERWPRDGVPGAPEAWLLVAARNRLTDVARRSQRTQHVQERLERAAAAASSNAEVEELEDQRLAMLFACAHPAISADVHGPLMMQAVLGLDAARIASAFLVAPATMGQRLVRAKRKIAAASIPLAVPAAEDFSDRLDAVLGAVYASFTAGWDDPGGVDPRSHDLADEALWLGRVIVRAVPHDPEARGTLALMLFATARRAARRDAGGAYVPLDAQNVARWDRAMLDEAEATLALAARQARIGRFQLEAAIQSAHSVRRFGRAPDWDAIVKLYDALSALTQSPVVALNRAVALGRANGPSAGLRALDDLTPDPRLANYQPYWAARAELLAELAAPEAAHAYERAIGLSADPSVRDYLRSRATRAV